MKIQILLFGPENQQWIQAALDGQTGTDLKVANSIDALFTLIAKENSPIFLIVTRAIGQTDLASLKGLMERQQITYSILLANNHQGTGLQELVSCHLELIKQKIQLKLQAEIIERSQKMSFMGELSGGLAHELNNPLNVIIAQTHLFQRKLTEDIKYLSRDNLLQDIQKIKKTAHRMSKIIKGLLRLFHGGIDTTQSKELAPMREIVEESLEIIEDSLIKRDIDLILSFRPEDLEIYCHKIELGQVIVNLVKNAMDAMDGQFENNKIEIDCWPDEEQINIDISDWGPGIPAHLAEKIMTPFFTTKKVGSGTGLGLGLCQKIVTNHGGLLTLANRSNPTKFLITLPINLAGNRKPDDHL